MLSVQRFIRFTASAMLLALVFTTLTAEAANEKPAQKKKGRPGNDRVAALALPESLELTSDQKEAVAEIRQKFSADAVKLQKKMNELLTPEQRQARMAAMKEARQAGKTPAEIREMTKAMNDELSPEIKEQQKEVRQEVQQLRQKFISEVSKILTDEQKEKLPVAKAGKGKKKEKTKPDGKKKESV